MVEVQEIPIKGGELADEDGFSPKTSGENEGVGLAEKGRGYRRGAVEDLEEQFVGDGMSLPHAERSSRSFSGVL